MVKIVRSQDTELIAYYILKNNFNNAYKYLWFMTIL